MEDTSSSNRRSSATNTMSAAAVEVLCAEVRQALKDKDTEEMMMVMAENNGWSFDEVINSPHLLTYMEMFLLNVPRVVEVRYFPNLTILKLMHISLATMVDLKPLCNVEELWLSDNCITKIEGLENMTRLRRLYLQGNRITSMNGLPVLKHLRELWLCRNAITTVSHLENVRKLRSLWISGNPISSLEGAFGSYLTHLHDVNLSGCRLYSFHHVTYLKLLPCLRNVWFADPLFGDNPICRLNNYTTYTLHMLDALDTLDYNNITPEQRSLADSIYSKKHIYYSMRIQTLNRNYWLLRERAEAAARRKLRGALDAKHDLGDYLLTLRGVLAEHQTYQGKSSIMNTGTSSLPSLQEMEDACKNLDRAVGTRDVEAEGALRRLAEALLTAAALRNQLRERLCLELNTGGNVRLEEVGHKDSWYENAKELILARFTEEAYKQSHLPAIKKVEVSRVFRVINKGLRLRFDDRVRELDIDLGDQASRKSLVCLFTAVPIERNEQDTLLQHVIIHGAESGSTAAPDASWDPSVRAYIPPNTEGLPLTNSLFYADEERLHTCHRRGEFSGVNENPNAVSGQIIIWRVFLGKSVAALGGTRQGYSNDGGSSNSNSGNNANGSPTPSGAYLRSDKKVLRKDYGSDVFSAYRSPTPDPNVRVWYCFDRALILPEFVIDYTYTLASPMTTPASLSLFHKPGELRQRVEAELPTIAKGDWNDMKAFCHPFVAFLNWCEAGTFDQFAQAETQRAMETGEAVVNKMIGPAAAVLGSGAGNNSTGDSSETSSASTVPLTESVVAAYSRAVGNPSGGLPLCHLRGRKLTVVPRTFSTTLFTPLITLDLSSNAITEFSWTAMVMAAPNLQTLNLSGNCLRTLDLQSCKMSQLLTLDLSFNQIDTATEFANAPASFPKLKKLSVEENPLMDAKDAEQLILSFFVSSPDFTQLNWVYTEALNKISLCRTRYDRTLDFNVRNNYRDGSDSAASVTVQFLVQTAYHNWQLSSAFDLLSLSPDVTPDRNFERGLRSLARVEPSRKSRAMQATLQEISDDPGSALPLSAVRTFQYHNSLMRDVTWVTQLSNLQHLLLRGHCLADISSVQQLQNLRILDVENNCLAELPDLSGLKHLTEINASFNVLSTLSGIGALPELRSLSVNGNRLDSLDTTHLAQCEKLEELYLAKNELSSAKEFYALKDLPELITLDVCCNPMTLGGASRESTEEVRFYLIYHFKRLKVLDGVPISQAEASKAKDTFSGKMSGDLLSERARVPQKQWPTLKEVDLSHCALREVSLLDAFTGLELLKLNHNALIKIDGVRALGRLKALNLSHNRLGTTPIGMVGEVLASVPTLESLSLESNHIQDLAHIALRLPHLKFLNLRGNELQFLDRGLDYLRDLREIVLDQNKLRSFNADCFSGCPLLTNISADENVIRSVEGVRRLQYLESISLGANRLGDLMLLLGDLGGCPLVRVTVVGNPAARKSNYRTTVIARFPRLVSLDGRDITADEREKAEAARNNEFVVPPNVFIDMNYVTNQQLQQQGAGMNGNHVGYVGPGAGGLATAAVLPSAHGRLQPMSGSAPPANGATRRAAQNATGRHNRGGR